MAVLRQVSSELGAAELDPVDREFAWRVEAKLWYAEAASCDGLGRAVARLAELGPDAGVTTAAERELWAVLLKAVTVPSGSAGLRERFSELFQQFPRLTVERK